MTTREEFITGLRQLADFLTVNPDVPVPEFGTAITLSTHGSDEENVRAVNEFALASGAEPLWDGGTHLRAKLHFGPIEYYIVAITRAAMGEANEMRRLGKEALAAKKAAEAVHLADALDGFSVPLCGDSDGLLTTVLDEATCDGCLLAVADEDAEEYVPTPFVKATPAELAQGYEDSAAYAAGLKAMGELVKQAEATS